MRDEPAEESESEPVPRKAPAPRIRVLRWLAILSFGVFALYFLFGHEPTSRFAIVGMIAALLALAFSYVVRLDDNRPGRGSA